MIDVMRRKNERSRRPVSTVVEPCRVVALTDARTGSTHLVTDEAMAAGRRAGGYLAVCGAEALAACLTVEADRFCPSCRDRVRR